MSFSSHVLWPEDAAVGTPGVTQDAAQHSGLSRSRSAAREDHQKGAERSQLVPFLTCQELLQEYL